MNIKLNSTFCEDEREIMYFDLDHEKKKRKKEKKKIKKQKRKKKKYMYDLFNKIVDVALRTISDVVKMWAGKKLAVLA